MRRTVARRRSFSQAAAGAFVAGCAGLAFWLGRKLPRVDGSLKAVLAGVLLLTLAQLVPLLGLVVFLGVLLLAPGCTVASGFGSGADWLLSFLEHGRPGHGPAPPD